MFNLLNNFQEFSDKVDDINKKHKEKIEHEDKKGIGNSLNEGLNEVLVESFGIMGEFVKLMVKISVPEDDNEAQEKIENIECTIM